MTSGGARRLSPFLLLCSAWPLYSASSGALSITCSVVVSHSRIRFLPLENGANATAEIRDSSGIFEGSDAVVLNDIALADGGPARPFLTVAAIPRLQFDLAYINVLPAAAGSGISLELLGSVSDLSTSERSPFSGEIVIPAEALENSDQSASLHAALIRIDAGWLSVGPGTPYTWLIANSTPEPEEPPTQLRRADSISVRASPILSGPAEGGGFVLDREDIRNLGTVLADDPLRAVQAIPGVTSDNDFDARFSLRGADFSRIGVYLDGVLLYDPIHSLEGAGLSGSAGVFDASTVGEMTLNDDAYSGRFADSSAAVLDVSMRDGSADSFHMRANASVAGAGMEAEGSPTHACSSITSFRKTYIQEILARTLTDPSMAFGIQDGQARVRCAISSANSIFLDAIDSETGLNRADIASQLGANALMMASQRMRFANFGWAFTPSDALNLTTHLAWTNDSFNLLNPSDAPLGNGSYREWTANSNLTWFWNPHGEFQAGGSARSRSADGFTENRDDVQNLEQVDAYNGRDTVSSGYASQAWAFPGGRLHLNASGRVDHDSLDRATTLAPQAGAAFAVTSSLRLSVGWGQYDQMPDITQLASDLGGARLRPFRSTHGNVAAEYKIGQNTLIRAEAYERDDRDLLFQPFFDPRIIGGSVFLPPANPLYENSLSGHSRGYEVYLHRKMSRRVAGWISYAYGRTEMHDAVTGNSFPSDQDQRQTVNTYVNYALSRTLDFSSRLSYGSGLPVPGYLTIEDGQYYLTAERNSARLPPYFRLDFRVNRTWNRGKWKKTLYVEALNATNHVNERFGSLDWYSPSTGKAEVTVDQMFPVLPNAGFVIER